MVFLPQGTYRFMTLSTGVHVIFLLVIIEQTSQGKDGIFSTFLFPEVTIRAPHILVVWNIR